MAEIHRLQAEVEQLKHEKGDLRRMYRRYQEEVRRETGRVAMELAAIHGRVDDWVEEERARISLRRKNEQPERGGV